jgi:hypothetical protein
MSRAAAAKLLIASLAAATLMGCAARPKTLYQWQGYQRQVYEFLKGDGSTPADQLAELQKDAEKARADGAALPPGFRAHLGLLYVRMGRYAEARQMLEAEKAAFPESTQYMDFVLKSMEEKKS